MTERWYTFPAQMGDHRAFLSFDDGFSVIADSDNRNFFLDVRVAIRRPSEAGLPVQEEFSALSEIDIALDTAITNKGGVYVGRLTVKGYRHFYFYIGFAEDIAAEIVGAIADETGYPLVYTYQEDASKSGYWQQLYPTMDDWQVIRDLNVLEALSQENNLAHVERVIRHWAYLKDDGAARTFTDWLEQSGYQLASVEPYDGEQTKVLFSHTGTTTLESITRHTIALNRRLLAVHGKYDGWECKVERK